MPGLSSVLSGVNTIAKYPHRGVQPLRHAGNLRNGGVLLELAILPDKNLLVVPPEANADVGQRREAVEILRQQVLTDRLRGMHDLGKAIVIVRGLDENCVVVAGGDGRPGNDGVIKENGKLHSREELTLGTGFQLWNACSIALEEAVVPLCLL